MKVRLAKTAGFCMGVRRAMEMVLTEANRGRGRILTYGPLIHNKQVMDLLASKGVSVVELSYMAQNSVAEKVWGKLGFTPFRVFSHKVLGKD